ncbi:ribosome maturation factor RimM [Deinococcus sp. KNUC1210]|uniref:ribosome maturation factor RimM n=1 Tax=Deinococcus sp. KNUC1210 TaxID=2917691 RepID=UPI001EEFBC49|nr:ribosome maturation factor RimM [Deinococcus sp. KNUC1210]ULH15347.1 ribosome maturation factor RimM [Deinococcus sp. KNUC1210]
MNVLPPDLTRMGHLMAPHGLRGAIKLFVIGEASQMLALKRLYVEELGWRRVTSVQPLGLGLALQLSGIDTREAALELRGRQVYAHDRELPRLDDGQYYYHELRGLPVRDAAGTTLGDVIDVQDMGFQDLLVIRHTGGEALVPLQAPYVQVKRGAAIVLDGAPDGLISGEAETVPPSSEEHLKDSAGPDDEAER